MMTKLDPQQVRLGSISRYSFDSNLVPLARGLV
jgi:hypothetical protein